MERHELLAILETAPEDEPVAVLVSDLRQLAAADIPEHVTIQPCRTLDQKSREFALEGTIARGDKTPLVALMQDDQSRKAWNLPLGIEDYFGLVRGAVEQRARSAGDVEYIESFVDENLVGVHYAILLHESDLHAAVKRASAVHSEIFETAEAITAGVEDLVVAAEKRLAGWGDDPLHSLVDRMREGTAHQKGLTLEELVSRLLGSVPGFTATGRVSTTTEEIDIRIQNASEHEVWRRESALLLAECKNWSGKCGKDEFVLFKSKLKNRTGRVSCGFLISWNGFAETVTSEMLRGTEGDLLIVPVVGQDLRGAVRDGDFPARLKKLYEGAVLL